MCGRGTGKRCHLIVATTTIINMIMLIAIVVVFSIILVVIVAILNIAIIFAITNANAATITVTTAFTDTKMGIISTCLESDNYQSLPLILTRFRL